MAKEDTVNNMIMIAARIILVPSVLILGIPSLIGLLCTEAIAGLIELADLA